MTVPRRNFLHKSVLGLLSVSLLPTSISFLRRNNPSLTVNDLFTGISFKQKNVSLSYLNEIFKQINGESGNINRQNILLYSGKTVCIPERDQVSTRTYENLTSIYEKTLDGYQKVITLNQMELLALQKMLTCLKVENGISDPKQFRAFLIPVLKTGRHNSQKNIIEGNCSSRFGYYTDYGFCSIRILAKGNRMKVNTSLRNHRKIETFQNSFEIPNLV